MNNEEYINKAIASLLEMYEKIENDLLVKIAEHFKFNEEFLNSDYWRLQKLEEMGLFNEEVIEYLVKYTNKTKAEIKKALEDIGYHVLDIEKLKSVFENGRLKIDPNILIQNNVIQEIIDSAYNELSNHFIEMSSKIATAARESYLNVVEEGYLKTSMGTHSYQEAIRESINELGNKGIRTLTYQTTDEAGNVMGIRNYDIESTVRREVLTGVRQLSNNINKSVVEELECEYVYLSEHIKCRPSHFDWQGTIIKYEDLVKVTHYGDVDGLAGINCAHYFEPYFGSARGDDLKTISKEEATKQYELSQKQRYLERGIRKWKRKVEMFKANGDNEAFLKSKDKVKDWQNRLSTFTKENNLRRDYNREYVSKNNVIFNDNISEDFKNVSKKVESLMIYDINNMDRLHIMSNNSKNSINADLKTLKLFMFSKESSLVVAHNHPSNSSFSFRDIETFNRFKSINSIVVVTDEHLYFLEKKEIKKFKNLEKDYYKLYNEFANKYGKTKETRHLVNQVFSKSKGWNYGRIKRK